MKSSELCLLKCLLKKEVNQTPLKNLRSSCFLVFKTLHLLISFYWMRFSQMLDYFESTKTLVYHQYGVGLIVVILRCTVLNCVKLIMVF